ncbi:hypothetical protein JTE90_006777 [Oedothorax gibbosus]|uniref:Uncharacterized protein n=1 Tax=Oedothorax gibbosus TaxID=931172 RepID=A0AAV6UL01_9ARAC|nr:hypothetical protein JTE90_006777 [Oedothorax gibbosus]
MIGSNISQRPTGSPGGKIIMIEVLLVQTSRTCVLILGGAERGAVRAIPIEEALVGGERGGRRWRHGCLHFDLSQKAEKR